MAAPVGSSDPHLAIKQLVMEARHVLAVIGELLPRTHDVGINFALLEAQSALKEAITSLSKASKLSKPK